MTIANQEDSNVQIELDDLGVLTQVIDQLDQLGVQVVEIENVEHGLSGSQADLLIRW